MKVDILNAICEDAKEITRDIIKNKLVDECNDHLAHILADNPVRISNIDNAISLQGQSAASVGQTLAVGYTFLTSLFEKSDYSFPFIVDSPANPIDTKVRREVGALIPRLVKQFVAFTISSERAGFMEGLETTAKEDILFMTVYRSDTDTNAAVVEMGKEAFEQFHQDRESANV
jgi:DNA sulfur modification protein DndD